MHSKLFTSYMMVSTSLAHIVLSSGRDDTPIEGVKAQALYNACGCTLESSAASSAALSPTSTATSQTSTSTASSLSDSACAGGVYADLALTLIGYSVAQAYCSSIYPVPPITQTITDTTATMTMTVAAETTAVAVTTVTADASTSTLTLSSQSTSFTTQTLAETETVTLSRLVAVPARPEWRLPLRSSGRCAE